MLDKDISAQLREALLKLDSYQQMVLELMLKGFNMFITGPGGVGKSFLIYLFRQLTDRRVAYLAPTGVASNNIAGSTIHSYFRLDNTLFLAKNIEFNKELKEKLSMIDTILIDEISMVRSDIFDGLNFILKLYATGKDKERPFAGRQLLLLGDFFQLSPVIEKRQDINLESYLMNAHNGIYAFDTRSWHEAGFRNFQLSSIYRQKDHRYQAILNVIRQGLITPEKGSWEAKTLSPSANVVDILNKSCFDPDGVFKDKPVLCPIRADAYKINKQKSNAIDSEIVTHKAKIVGSISEYFNPAPYTLNLKIGQKVMCLANTPDYNNGTLGYIEDIIVVDNFPKKKDITVKVRLSSDKLVDIKPFKFDYFQHEKVIDDSGDETIECKKTGYFEQLPLQIAYAFTIHKSQSLSLDELHLHLGERGCFAGGQAYTGLSRCRSLETLSIGHPIRPRDVIADGRVKEFYRRTKFEK